MTDCRTCLSRGGCAREPIPWHCDDYRPDPRVTDKHKEDR